jgi:hypothetical protein
LVLQDQHGRALPLQARALDCWPDGSVRWALLDWHADPAAGPYRVAPARHAAENPSPVNAVARGDSVSVQSGSARFELGVGDAFPFRAVQLDNQAALDAARSHFLIEDEAGRVYRPRITRIEVEESGVLRTAVFLQGYMAAAGAEPLTDFDARMHFFTGAAAVRFELTLRNPRKADHPGGLWDLGSGGSIYLRDATLTLALPPGAGSAVTLCSPELRAPFERLEGPVELYQDSSGGENWQSSNHVNRHRVVPNTFRGYRLKARTVERGGLRATPAVCLTAGQRLVGVTVPHFWQNFPQAIETTTDTLALRLFPRQYADVHELQGGEQKTHRFSILFGTTATSAAAQQALNWHRAQVRAAATPAWYCSTSVIPYLTPKSDDPNTDYLRLVDAAIDGPDTFEQKREVIDEYGWRHFGDIYGDHEAVLHKGPTPLVSHYNNQYDPIAGFGYQFLRSGDLRWLRHMEELAAHVIDIDIYHTDHDKAAYNHGLFWHTFHYVDADTATHRSYPRSLLKHGGKPHEDPNDPQRSGRPLHVAYALGGGPADEQNYASGLALHFFLTGDPGARAAALGLARWVIDMDDGRKTVFRWLAGGSTGLASQSRNSSYHGPGRGSGNSTAALLDGHRLSGDPAFLAKAEQLIRRCIHPADDVPRRNLLDVENRWFYTMFLQALGRYLDYKAERGERDSMYAYGRASLLHYARWMADNERPYLDRPEILEYPNETWAAQDMRKSEVFKYAARHGAGAERARFRERAEFFFRYSVEKLSSMPTRTLARPVVLLLCFGPAHAFFQRHTDSGAPPPDRDVRDFGAPEVFIPQKLRALRRFKLLAATGAAVATLGIVYLISLLFR